MTALGMLQTQNSISRTREWIQRRLRGDLCFVIELALSPCSNGTSNSTSRGHEESHGAPPIRRKVIGTNGSSNSNDLPDIGCAIGRASWRKGDASEALQGLIDAYWREYRSGNPGLEGDNRDILKADTRWNNYASQGALKKPGFDWYREMDVVNVEGKQNTYYYYRIKRPSTP